jgi:hypothetical protein
VVDDAGFVAELLPLHAPAAPSIRDTTTTLREALAAMPRRPRCARVRAADSDSLVMTYQERALGMPEESLIVCGSVRGEGHDNLLRSGIAEAVQPDSSVSEDGTFGRVDRHSAQRTITP